MLLLWSLPVDNCFWLKHSILILPPTHTHTRIHTYLALRKIRYQTAGLGIEGALTFDLPVIKGPRSFDSRTHKSYIKCRRGRGTRGVPVLWLLQTWVSMVKLLLLMWLHVMLNAILIKFVNAKRKLISMKGYDCKRLYDKGKCLYCFLFCILYPVSSYTDSGISSKWLNDGRNVHKTGRLRINAGATRQTATV